ncbi:MAG: hypothetical protein UT09_C0051G0009 [Parcubacteria group bacterium GW2011_GWF2_38_8]|nr:MAG: hypothetical protein UT09_C0051G0009 [Parcubacteria group bacterium GW2011_GWF2_38_8]
MLRRIESGITARGLKFDYLLWVEKLAFRFGIKGIIFTKNDGSVKIIAEGEEKNLLELVKKIEGGIFSGR